MSQILAKYLRNPKKIKVVLVNVSKVVMFLLLMCSFQFDVSGGGGIVETDEDQGTVFCNKKGEPIALLVRGALCLETEEEFWQLCAKKSRNFLLQKLFLGLGFRVFSFVGNKHGTEKQFFTTPDLPVSMRLLRSQ